MPDEPREMDDAAVAGDGAEPTDGKGTLETLSLDAPQFRPAARHPRRAENTAAVLFLASVACYAGFGAAYWVNASSSVLGATIGLGMLLTGAAMVVWGKYLMPKGPFVEPRHRMVPTPEERERMVGDFASRGKIAIEGRRLFLLKMMGAAVGVLSVVAAFPLLRSLGPLPGKTLYGTKWRKGSPVVTLDGTPVNVSDLDVGGAMTVFPAGDLGSAISQTMLIRPSLTPVPTRPGRETWSPDGYLAYSKVCTHAGCPVGLYQEETQQLLCPCHQSLFDVMNGGEPVFGPAPRPLPQLALYADDQGFLHAQGPYDEPIGPGFWERGND
jgi:ubiquinol-cytochrome c reductase iron-sulfur subunit